MPTEKKTIAKQSKQKNKQAFWNMIRAEMKKHGLTEHDFKTDPAKLYAKSASYRSWLHSHVKEPTRMPIYGGRQYNMINGIARLPNADEVMEIMRAEAPSGWADKVTNQREIDEQQITLEEFLNADVDFDTVTDEEITNPTIPTAGPSKQPSVVDQFPKTKGAKGPDNKRKHGEPTTSDIPSKVQVHERRGSTDDQPDQTDPQKSEAPKKATNITGTETTTEPPQVNPVGSQQVDTNRGPNHNEGGTVQGEAGNRKVQKKARVFGLIEVNMATKITKTYFFGFKSQDAAENFIKLLNCIYTNQHLFTLKYITDLPVAKLTTWFVLVKLNFNIGYTTLKNKIGTSCDKLNYFWHCNFIWEDKEDDMRTKVNEFIDIHVKNNVASLTWDGLIEMEKSKLAYRNKTTEEKPAYTPTW